MWCLAARWLGGCSTQKSRYSWCEEKFHWRKWLQTDLHKYKQHHHVGTLKTLCCNHRTRWSTTTVVKLGIDLGDIPWLGLQTLDSYSIRIQKLLISLTEVGIIMINGSNLRESWNHRPWVRFHMITPVRSMSTLKSWTMVQTDVQNHWHYWYQLYQFCRLSIPFFKIWYLKISNSKYQPASP